MHSIFGEYGVFAESLLCQTICHLAGLDSRPGSILSPPLPRVHKTLAMSDSHDHAGTGVHVCSVRKR